MTISTAGFNTEAFEHEIVDLELVIAELNFEQRRKRKTSHNFFSTMSLCDFFLERQAREQDKTFASFFVSLAQHFSHVFSCSICWESHGSIEHVTLEC
jgi:hypothetical protein